MGPKKKDPVKSPPSKATSPSASSHKSDEEEKLIGNKTSNTPKSPKASAPSQEPKADSTTSKKTDPKAGKTEPAKAGKTEPAKAGKTDAAKVGKSDSEKAGKSDATQACKSKCAKGRGGQTKGFWASLCGCCSPCCKCCSCCHCSACCRKEGDSSAKYKKEGKSGGKVDFDSAICESPKAGKKDDATQPLMKSDAQAKGSAAAAKKVNRKK